MELSLDIFKNDAFSVQSLQRVVKNAPYIPSELGQMGLFESKPILTEQVLLYEEDGTGSLIPITERGGPDAQQIRPGGRLRALETSRLSKKDSVRAGELFGLANTALSQDIRLRNAQDLVSSRTQQLKTDLEFTKELHRYGAIQGKLVTTRLDGTSFTVNFFTEYGITEPAPVEIDFAGTSEDDLAQDLAETFRQPIIKSLLNRATPNVRIGALVGDDMWSALHRHPAVREIWKAQQVGRAMAMAANPLATPSFWDRIEFAGIEWIHYRGSTNDEIAVPAKQAIFFPIGARDVFNVYWSPGETLLDVNQPGEPEYLYIQPDVRTNMPEYVDIVLRSYPLYACIYPKCLMRATLP